MRPINIHLATTQRLPEPINADMAHTPIRNSVDQFPGEGKPLFQIVDAEEREGVD
jgi:hypothetical protein